MNIYEEAIKKWGVAAQITNGMEECGELIAALNQYFFRDRITKQELASEVADVELVCRQIREIIGGAIVDEQKAGKITRLKERLSND